MCSTSMSTQPCKMQASTKGSKVTLPVCARCSTHPTHRCSMPWATTKDLSFRMQSTQAKYHNSQVSRGISALVDKVPSSPPLSKPKLRRRPAISKARSISKSLLASESKPLQARQRRRPVYTTTRTVFSSTSSNNYSS